MSRGTSTSIPGDAGFPARELVFMPFLSMACFPVSPVPKAFLRSRGDYTWREGEDLAVRMIAFSLSQGGFRSGCVYLMMLQCLRVGAIKDFLGPGCLIHGAVGN